VPAFLPTWNDLHPSPDSERDRMNEDVLLDQTGFTLDAIVKVGVA
jgi:hypothetical protein